MDKTKKIIRIIAILLFIAGVLIFGYPYISEVIYDNRVNSIVDTFNTDIKESDLLEELYQRMLEENISMYNDGQKGILDPFSYEEPGIDLTQYGISENIVGYIVIPKINERLPIYLGAGKENMTKGAVHLTQTSYPIGGNNTNSVIAAHRGYSQAMMFRYIDRLEKGDEIYIVNFREELKYQVSEIKIILPEQVEEILIQPGKDLVTLITCHPYRHNYQRYVVYCERVL